jgi:hypothetical protein
MQYDKSMKHGCCHGLNLLVYEKIYGEGGKKKKENEERKITSGPGQGKMISEYSSQNQASLVKSHRQDERTA